MNEQDPIALQATVLSNTVPKDSLGPEIKEILPSKLHRKLLRLGFRLEPIVDLVSGAMIGKEILRDGIQYPLNVLWWVWYSRLGRIQNADHSDMLFVNLHTAQIHDEYLMDFLLSGFPDLTRLVLEWTEQPSSRSELFEAARILKECRDRFGVRICVDDFGAGADGVQRLGFVNPDIVKIDGPFLHAARSTTHGRTLLRSMVHLIEDSGASAVVEWIESRRDLEIARSVGARWGQGFLWPHRAGSI